MQALTQEHSYLIEYAYKSKSPKHPRNILDGTSTQHETSTHLTKKRGKGALLVGTGARGKSRPEQREGPRRATDVDPAAEEQKKGNEEKEEDEDTRERQECARDVKADPQRDANEELEMKEEERGGRAP